MPGYPKLRRPNWFTRLAALLLTCVAFAVAAATSEACPMCKIALGSDRDRLIHAWGISIVFMLSMPMLIFTTLAVKMYLLVRKSRIELEAPKPRDQVSPSAEPLSPVSTSSASGL